MQTWDTHPQTSSAGPLSASGYPGLITLPCPLPSHKHRGARDKGTVGGLCTSQVHVLFPGGGGVLYGGDLRSTV